MDRNDQNGMQDAGRQSGRGEPQEPMNAAGPREGGNISDDRVGTTANQTGSNRPSDVDRMQGRPASGSWGEEGLGNGQTDDRGRLDRESSDRGSMDRGSSNREPSGG
jgi:hypothetical protein